MSYSNLILLIIIIYLLRVLLCSNDKQGVRIISHLFIRSIGNVITTVHNGCGRRNYRANRHLRFIVSLTTEVMYTILLKVNGSEL